MNKKILGLAMVIIALDQISKIITSSMLKLGVSKTIISNFFYLTYVKNDGVAWGMLDKYPFLIIIGTLIALVLIYHFTYSFKENTRNNIAFGLIYGGLFGNLCDRLFLGYVRDFLDFYIFKYDYPVFNVADIAIVIGVVLLIVAILKGEDKRENSSK